MVGSRRMRGGQDCPPCVPPVGTIRYRFDRVPPSRPHQPFKGDHYHLCERNQNPYTCECFWNPLRVTEGHRRQARSHGRDENVADEIL